MNPTPQKRDFNMLKIDRTQIEKSFNDYVAPYDMNDEKILLKVKHTFRVASLCEQIAKSEQLEPEDVELSWLTGMLHDIGRFEQIRRYGTFSDADSIDHAEFGADLLFKEGLIEKFGSDFNSEDAEATGILETAIRCHSMYRLPAELDKRTITFCQILRDADKIDILRVNIDSPLEKIYNITTQLIMNSEVSEAVMESFMKKQATLRSIKKTPVDHVVGHISLVFELVYPESIQIVKRQGCLDKLLTFKSDNTRTCEQFEQIRDVMKSFI